MEKLIFDTNAYRYLASENSKRGLIALIQKLKHREKLNGIESLLNPIAAQELLAHVATRKDKSFVKCLKAIKALYYHSGNNSEFGF